MRGFAPLLASAALFTVTIATHAHHPRDVIVARDALKPSFVCGTGVVDCNNGFCCSAGQTCVSHAGLPVCQVPAGSIAVASPYDNASMSAAQNALSNYLATVSSTASSTVVSSTTSSAVATSTAVYSSYGYGYGNGTTTAGPTATAPILTGGYASATSSASGSAASASFTAGAVSGPRVAWGVAGALGLMGLAL